MRLPMVGILWSSVAKVRSGRRSLRPASRNPANACGDVTSCTRCRSIYRICEPSGPAQTTCWAQILSKSVRTFMIEDSYSVIREAAVQHFHKALLHQLSHFACAHHMLTGPRHVCGAVTIGQYPADSGFKICGFMVHARALA